MPAVFSRATAFTVAVCIVLVSLPVAAADDTGILNLMNPPIERGIIINVPAFTLFYVEAGRVIAAYPIGVGRTLTSTPEGPRVTETPLGEFKVVVKKENPYWNPPAWLKEARGWGPDHIVGPGPDNPLGARWIGFDPTGYGIHGTNNVDSLGHPASLGCIRMANESVTELYDMVRVGDPVLTVHRRATLYADIETGEPTLLLVPDLYSSGAVQLEALRHELRDLGYEITIRRLQGIADWAEDAPVSFVLRQEDTLVINGRTVGRVLVQSTPDGGEIVLVPLTTTLEQLAVPGLAPEQMEEGVLASDLRMVTVDETRYAEWTELVSALEIGGEWAREERALYVWNTAVNLFGYVATRDAYRSGGSVYVNLPRLVHSRLARYFKADGNGGFTVLGEPVEVEHRGGSSYTTVECIAERFRANAYWDHDANRALITYR